MAPIALESWKILTLMLVGVVFAGFGLWLILRPPAGAEAHLKIFGIELRSSSVGLLVFLVGAAFFATPLVVPERPSTAGPGKSTGAPPVLQSMPVGGAEIEPNDHPRGPNVIEVGSVYGGEAGYRDRDYYTAAIAEDAGRLRVVWRVLESEPSTERGRYVPSDRCSLSMLDRYETEIDSFANPGADGRAKSDAYPAGDFHGKATLLVSGVEGSCRYELELSYEAF